MAGIINPIQQVLINEPSWDILRDIGVGLDEGRSTFFSCNHWPGNGFLSSYPEGIITRIKGSIVRVFVTSMESREYDINNGSWGDINRADRTTITVK